MVYLNQAATTYPKPNSVIEAVTDAMNSIPQGQFRSTLSSEDVFVSCKEKLGRLFGTKNFNNIFFSAGATAGANALFYGLNLEGKDVIVTAAEHNSILRPAMNLPDKVGGVLIAPCDELGKVNEHALKMLLEDGEDVAAVFINHCSNVTGYIQDLEGLAKLCHKYNKYVFADFSQSAGCVPIYVDEWLVDGFIFAGHKGLYGIQGIGGYYVRPGIDFKPFMFGGTGRDSKQLIYQNDYEYEVGTGAGPAVAGLNAGVNYVLEKGVENIRTHELNLMDQLYQALEDLPCIKYIKVPRENRGPVVSLNFTGMKPGDVAYILQNGYEIIVRTGLHCAPLIHKAIGSYPEGTVRVSVSDFNTKHDIDELISAFKDISDGLQSN